MLPMCLPPVQPPPTYYVPAYLLPHESNLDPSLERSIFRYAHLSRKDMTVITYFGRGLELFFCREHMLQPDAFLTFSASLTSV